jgi:hypothetical protein
MKLGDVWENLINGESEIDLSCRRRGKRCLLRDYRGRIQQNNGRKFD